MIAFVIPVKHPEASRSYERVTYLLRRTVESILRQTDGRLVVVVVCSRRPEWAGELASVQFVEVDFPVPAPPSSQAQEHRWGIRDKGAKTAVGLMRARELGATRVMCTDADDLVSRRIVEFVHAHPDVPGWFVQSGYLYSDQFKLIEPLDEFFAVCGTSHVMPTEMFPLDAFPSGAPSRDEIVAALGVGYVEDILGDHNKWRRWCEARGAPLRPLPFPGAIWRADTGENVSRAWWRQRRFGPIWGGPPSAELRDEFGLEPGSRDMADSAQLLAWRVRNVAGRVGKRAIAIARGGTKA